MSLRLPKLVEQLLAEERLPDAAKSNLQALQRSLPHGRLRLLQDQGAPDFDTWNSYLASKADESWLSANWFPAECYFYRRVLEATGYYIPGPGENWDPFASQKAAGLEQARKRLPPLTTTLSQTIAQPFSLATLRFWLTHALWGNQADLSLWQADASDQPANQTGSREDQLLVDATPALEPLFAALPLDRIDIILDNAGVELTNDLLLADYLLATGVVRQIILHAKAHPTFVSDATIKDVQKTIRFLSKNRETTAMAAGERLANYVAFRQLHIHTHFYWNSPRYLWEIDTELGAELATSSLIVSKGDANYRRIIGDYYWPDERPFSTIGPYLPAPLLALRTLKSEVVIGLDQEMVRWLDSSDPDWRINGRWGVMQLATRGATGRL